jgi:hypothetical protein
MSYRRQISWSMALRDLRHERGPRPAVNPVVAQSLQFAKAADALRAIQDRPLLQTCHYDRSAIMALALAMARKERAKGSKAHWWDLMHSALKFAWARARAMRATAAH